MAKKNTGAVVSNPKYQEDEGFMRGARIAEKIQEYYHSNQNPGATLTSFNQVSKQNSTYNQSNGANSTIKQYGAGK